MCSLIQRYCDVSDKPGDLLKLETPYVRFRRIGAIAIDVIVGLSAAAVGGLALAGLISYIGPTAQIILLATGGGYLALTAGVHLIPLLHKNDITRNDFSNTNRAQPSSPASNSMPVVSANSMPVVSAKKQLPVVKGKICITSPTLSGVLGSDLAELGHNTASVERIDGVDWKQKPNEVLFECEGWNEQGGFGLHLPGYLFIQEGNYTRPKQDGDIVMFNYQGKQYQLTISQNDHEFKYQKGAFCDVYTAAMSYAFVTQKGISNLPRVTTKNGEGGDFNEYADPRLGKDVIARQIVAFNKAFITPPLKCFSLLENLELEPGANFPKQMETNQPFGANYFTEEHSENLVIDMARIDIKTLRLGVYKGSLAIYGKRKSTQEMLSEMRGEKVQVVKVIPGNNSGDSRERGEVFRLSEEMETALLSDSPNERIKMHLKAGQFQLTLSKQ